MASGSFFLMFFFGRRDIPENCLGIEWALICAEILPIFCIFLFHSAAEVS